LPLFENDFVLAKMLPICTVLNNTAMTVAIANADVLWFFAMPATDRVQSMLASSFLNFSRYCLVSTLPLDASFV
jgi:hypothetical protein